VIGLLENEPTVQLGGQVYTISWYENKKLL
jgi:hypothetical protein